MAFDLANLAPIGNTSKPLSGVGTTTLKGAPTWWSYVTADTLATVNTANYFDAAVKLLRKGDMVNVLSGAGSGGTLASALALVVDNDGTHVDIADGTVVAVTDGD